MKLFILAVILCIFAVTAQEYDPCPRGLETSSDESPWCYWWSSLGSFGLVNWFEARRDCMHLNADLASIADIPELNYLSGRHDVGGGRRMTDYWLGGTDEPGRNGTWVWADGTPWSNEVATNGWGLGRPRGSPHHCNLWWGGALNMGTWNDRNCDNVNLLFLCKFRKTNVCTCAENESKECDIGFGCRDFRVCESGRVITVECPEGQVVNNETMECQPILQVPPPCGDYRNCTGMADGSYPIQDDFCRSYYRCEGGNIQLTGWCPDGSVFDQPRQVCLDIDQVCPPCGRATETPVGPCPPVA